MSIHVLRNHLLRAFVGAAVAVLALTPALRAEVKGRVILVAREEIENEAFRKELAELGGEGASRLVLALSEEPSLPGVDRCFAAKSRKTVLDRELCRRVESVDVLVLRGGTFMQWFETLYPEDGGTYLARAIRERVRAKRLVIAYGGACAFLCNGTSIPREDLDEQERNPRNRDPFAARVAMALGPEALIDSDDLPGGSPFRTLHALWKTRLDLGFHLVGDVALDYRREGGKVFVLGPGAVLAFDLDRARRKKRAVREARISLLRRGDGWDQVFDRPFTAPDRIEPASRKERRGETAVEGPLLTAAPALVAALEALGGSAHRRFHLEGGSKRLEVHWDEASRLWKGPRGVALLGLEVACSWD